MSDHFSCPYCNRLVRVVPTNRSATPSPTTFPNRVTGGNWEPKPMTMQRALNFQWPFRKHKGRTLREIMKIDPGYVEWAAEALEPGSAQRAAQFLAEHADELDQNTHQPRRSLLGQTRGLVANPRRVG